MSEIYPDWNNLPDLILVQVFSNLPKKDRFNAGLVCRKWGKNFYALSLWEDMKFAFSGYDSDAKASRFLERYSPNLRCLEVGLFDEYWLNPDPNPKHLEDFFKNLNDKEPQLERLVLKDCIYTGEFLDESSLDQVRMVGYILKFLKKQKSLKSIDLERSFLPTSVGFQFLNSVVLNSGDCIEVLKLKHLFCEGFEESDGKEFFGIISRLKKLKFLSLDNYCGYLNRQILETLKKVKFPKFELVQILCTNETEVLLKAQDWTLLQKIFGNIEVEYSVDSEVEITDLREVLADILPESLPLKKLQLAHFKNPTDVIYLMEYVGKHYANSLVTLNLNNVNCGTETTSYSIMSCLRKLQNLRNFGISTTSMVEDVEQILDWIFLEKLPKLKSVCLCANHIYHPPHDDATKSRLKKKYKPMFAWKKVNFTLLNEHLAL